MFINNGAISLRVSIFNLNVTSFDPARITHAQSKSPDARFRFGIIFGDTKQHTHAPHSVGLLGLHRQGPTDC
jgi:hypothetical protein